MQESCLQAIEAEQKTKKVSMIVHGNFFFNLTSLVFLTIFSCPMLCQGQPNAIRMTKAIMGTKFTIVVYSNRNASEAVQEAFNEVEYVNKIFSSYDDDSQVSKLNSSRKWQTVSPDLIHLVTIAEELNQTSNGAFDIKIGKGSKLWKNAIKKQVPPDPNKIEKISKKRRQIKSRSSQLKTNRNTLLDFGAIAKGYAVDKAFEKLQSMGYDTILVDGGGDIRVGEKPRYSEGWKISQFLEDGEILFLDNCSIASSGAYYQSVESESGQRQSHIIDPQSMQGISDNIGVTVISETCTIADALSTTHSIIYDTQKLKQVYKYKVNIKDGNEWIIKEF